ncbi:unnamed protein product [Bemisia tabaci]|uniref:Uncharacterized protein n=1 Tax=Bemisia tabaci TaxID=7038 RepID=A0A9P0A407_BEMTA|nr:unnamed protein product [Bemisia tabaci]
MPPENGVDGFDPDDTEVLIKQEFIGSDEPSASSQDEPDDCPGIAWQLHQVRKLGEKSGNLPFFKSEADEFSFDEKAGVVEPHIADLVSQLPKDEDGHSSLDESVSVEEQQNTSYVTDLVLQPPESEGG